MNKYNFDIKRKKGAVLLYVLITFLVLVILATVILDIGSAETRFSVNDSDKVRAYYIARSGAEAFAQSAQNNTSFSPTGTISFGGGSFNVTVDTTNPGKPVIVSKGTYHNAQKTVKLGLTAKNLFPTTIYAKDNIQMDNNSDLNGDVEVAAGGTVTGDLSNIHGTIAYNSTKTFDDIPLHYDPSTAASFSGSTMDGTIPVYNNISLGSRSLNVNTGGNKIEVDANSFTGNNCDVHVSGGGIFILHINYLDFKGNFYTDSNTTSIIVIAPGGSAFADFRTGNSVFQAFIYGPSASVDIKANMDMTGAIIARNVTIESGGQLTYSSFPSPIPYIDPSILNLSPNGFDKSKWED